MRIPLDVSDPAHVLSLAQMEARQRDLRALAERRERGITATASLGRVSRATPMAHSIVPLPCCCPIHGGNYCQTHTGASDD